MHLSSIYQANYFTHRVIKFKPMTALYQLYTLRISKGNGVRPEQHLVNQGYTNCSTGIGQKVGPGELFGSCIGTLAGLIASTNTSGKKVCETKADQMSD